MITMNIHISINIFILRIILYMNVFSQIIDPEADEVRIEQRWHTVDYILTSMLSVRNMTTSAQFECEAVNEHVWGASVKSKKFNVIVLPNSGKGVKLSAKLTSIIWATTRENLSSGFANNTGADQPAHSGSLISAFVIHFLESIICKLAAGEISIFQLVSVAEETGLKLASSDIRKTGFRARRPIYFSTTQQSFSYTDCPQS